MVIIIASALLSYFFSGEQDLIKVNHFCSLSKMIFNIPDQIVSGVKGKSSPFEAKRSVKIGELFPGKTVRGQGRSFIPL
jgi:hypothetical protein